MCAGQDGRPKGSQLRAVLRAGTAPWLHRHAAPDAHLACPLQTDLADEQQLREIEAEVRGVNAEAGITRCRRCEIDLGLILNTGLYSAGLRGVAAAAANGSSGGAAGAADAEAAAGSGGGEQPTGQQGQGEHACGPQCSNPAHAHHHHHHHGSSSDPNRVGTVTITLPPGQPLDLARLRHWLDTLLWEDGTADAADLFRVKGLLCVAGSAHKHVLQVGRGVPCGGGCWCA